MCNHYTDQMVDDMRAVYEEQIETLKTTPITEHPDIQRLIGKQVELQAKYDALKQSHNKLVEVCKPLLEGYCQMAQMIQSQFQFTGDQLTEQAEQALSEAEKCLTY